MFGLGLASSGWAAAPQGDPADAAWGRRDLATAERLYARRLAADSSDPQALYRMGMIFAWNHRYGEGIALLEQLATVEPNNVEVRVDRARVMAWRGDFDGSLTVLDSLLQDNPRRMDVLEVRAQVASWSGQTGVALNTYHKLLGLAPNPGAVRRRAQLGLARALGWSGELDSSRAIYRGMLRKDSTNAAALRGLARTTAWMGNLVAAEGMWRRAIGLDSSDLDAVVGLSQTLRWQGRVPEAFEVAQRMSEPTADGAVGDEKRELHSLLGPRARAAITRENDSDGNDMTTFQLRTGWHPHQRLAVAFDGYLRQAEFPVGVPDRRARGATVSISGYLVPGWSLSGGVGASGSNGVTGRTFFNGFASIATPRKYGLNGSVTYRRAPVDATALLIERGVSIAEFVAVAGARPGTGWVLTAEIAGASLSGTQDNSRTLGRFSVNREITANWDVGGRFRAFGYERDINDGYFDPDFYMLIEAPVRWRHDFTAWRVVLEVAPGLQQIGSGGSLDGAVGLDGRVTYAIAPGRDLGFKVIYSRSGASTFATGDTNYRYVAVGAIATWVF